MTDVDADDDDDQDYDDDDDDGGDDDDDDDDDGSCSCLGVVARFLLNVVGPFPCYAVFSFKLLLPPLEFMCTAGEPSFGAICTVRMS